MERVQIIPDLFSKEECDALIAKLEDSPLLQADRNGADYQRSVIYDQAIANILTKRMSHLIPRDINAVCISDRIRFSKYNPNGEFSLHQDGIHQDPRTGYRSTYTLSIFLNDGFTGGETDFLFGNQSKQCQITKVGVTISWKSHFIPS